MFAMFIVLDILYVLDGKKIIVIPGSELASEIAEWSFYIFVNTQLSFKLQRRKRKEDQC